MKDAKTRKAIEKVLEDTRAQRDYWLNSGTKVSKAFALKYTNVFDGQIELAEELGFDCACVEKGASLKSGVDCSCFTNPRVRKALAALSGSANFTLDGKRCRDAQGAFVPVAQCRGRVVGRDKAGRFVSMKG